MRQMFPGFGPQSVNDCDFEERRTNKASPACTQAFWLRRTSLRQCSKLKSNQSTITSLSCGRILEFRATEVVEISRAGTREKIMQ